MVVLCKINLEDNNSCANCCKYCINKCSKRCVFDRKNVDCSHQIIKNKRRISIPPFSSYESNPPLDGLNVMKEKYNTGMHSEDILKALLSNNEVKINRLLDENSFINTDMDIEFKIDNLENMLIDNCEYKYISRYIDSLRDFHRSDFINKLLCKTNSIETVLRIASNYEIECYDLLDDALINLHADIHHLLSYINQTINSYDSNKLFNYVVKFRKLYGIDSLLNVLEHFSDLNDENKLGAKKLFLGYYKEIISDTPYSVSVNNLCLYLVKFLDLNIVTNKQEIIELYLDTVKDHEYILKLINYLKNDTYNSLIIEKAMDYYAIYLSNIKSFYIALCNNSDKKVIDNIFLENLRKQLKVYVYTKEKEVIIADFLCNVMKLDYEIVKPYLLDIDLSKKEIFLDVMRFCNINRDIEIRDILLNYDLEGKYLIKYLRLSNLGYEEDLIIIRDKLISLKEIFRLDDENLLSLLKIKPNLFNDKCLNLFLDRNKLNELVFIYNNVSTDGKILRAIVNYLVLKNNYNLFKDLLNSLHKRLMMEEYYFVYTCYISLKSNNSSNNKVCSEVINNNILNNSQKYDILKKHCNSDNCIYLVEFYKKTLYGNTDEILGLLFYYDFVGKSLFEMAKILQNKSISFVNLILEQLCKKNVESHYISEFFNFSNVIIPKIYLDTLTIEKLIDFLFNSDIKNGSSRKQLEDKLIELDLSGKNLYKILLNTKEENGYDVYRAIIEKKNFYSFLAKTKFKKIYGEYLNKEKKQKELTLDISVIDELSNKDQILIVLKKLELKILKLRALGVSDVLLKYVEETITKLLNANKGLFNEEIVINRLLEVFSSMDDYLTSLKTSNENKENYLNKNDAMQSSKELEDIINAYKSMTDENKYTDYLINNN